MNKSDVVPLVNAVKSNVSDDEVAHSLEDDLHVAVLRAIADGTCEDPQECAKLALSTLDLDFCRWCA